MEKQQPTTSAAVVVPPLTQTGGSGLLPHASLPGATSVWWSSGRARALILTLISTLSYSLHALFVKKVTSISSYELVAISGAITLVPSGIMLAILRINPFKLGPSWRDDVIMLISRGILGLFVDVLRVIALHFLPLGDCTTILFSNPIVVAAAAPFVLQEKLLPSTVFAVVLTIAGIVLVSRPTILFDREGFLGHTDKNLSETVLSVRGFGIATAITATVLSGVVLIMLRMMRHINEHVVVLWAAVMTLIGGVVLAYAVDGKLRVPISSEMLNVFLAGFFLYGSNLFVTLAFQFDAAARVASLRTTVVVWSFVWQVAIFHEPISRLAITGALLVMTSVAIVGWSDGGPEEPIKRQAYDEIEGVNVATHPVMILSPTASSPQMTIPTLEAEKD